MGSYPESGLTPSYAVFPTALGWMAVACSDRGITRLTLPMPSRRAALALAGRALERAVEDASAFGDLPLRLRRYFDGEVATFSDRLDLTRATTFQIAVWNATRRIPYGEVRSYGWVARQVGSPHAGRAVGQALARNPFPIVVPCHRVLASDGSLGGFNGGLDLKMRLLKLEDRSTRHPQADKWRRHSRADRSSS